MKLSNMKIGTKLLMLIGLMSLVTVIVAGFGVSRIIKLNSGLHNVGEIDSMVLLGARINQNLITMTRSEYRVAADPSAGTIAAAREVANTNRQEFNERLARIVAGAATDDERRQLQDIQTAYAAYADGLDATYERAQRLSGQVSLNDAQRQINDGVNVSRIHGDALAKAIKAYAEHLDAKSQKTNDDATAAGRAAIVITLAVTTVGIGLGFVFGIIFAKTQLVRPIQSLTEAMEAVARGEDRAAVPGADRGDEIGAMSRAFGNNATRIAKLAEQQREQEVQAALERKAATMKLADDFEKSVGSIVTLVSSAATELQAAATQLTATAEETSAQSVAVSAAADEAGTNVTSVAGAAEELGASVSEIGRQVESSTEISSTAVAEATAAAQVVAELDEVAASIGSVVDTISNLASQTNLLALNATIESARAGEAGKGFAVVASEVKQLAGQTAKATTDISAKIVQIQSVTAKAVSAIQNITGTIQEINGASTAIASAVDQQGAATREIVHAINQASLGTGEVTANITGVAQAAEQTGAAASQVLSSSSELAEQAARLHHEMDSFLATVRAA